ncbi:MAG: peptidoglycan DD-metalloendopeptidase family protein [Anaerolineae bacterium]
MSDFKFQTWPTEFRKITQHFGANPQNYAQFGLPGHEGVDIRARSGSKVYCVAPGEVVRVHPRPNGHNYGIHVRVNHQDGYQTTYAHLQEIFVRVGERVEAGTVLGLADNTGNSFGSHLHLTLKKRGVQLERWPPGIIDPTPFLLPLMGWREPIGPYVGGWVLASSIVTFDNLAQANPDGVTLRIGPAQGVLIPGGTIMLIAGPAASGFMPVQVAKAAVGLDDPDFPAAPAPEPPAHITTINGWAWADFLTITHNQGIVNTRHGINLRLQPDSQSRNIGVVRRGSTVTILGRGNGGYLPVRVRRADFVGSVNLPADPPELPDGPLTDLPDDIYLGWVETQFLRAIGIYATVRHRGVNLRSKAANSGKLIGSVKGDATVTVAGPARAGYTPVLVQKESLYRITSPRPEVQLPDPFPNGRPASAPMPGPSQQNRRGWVLTADILVTGDHATAGPHGLNLRDGPHRNAASIAFIPPAAAMIVTDDPQGEFTPVRVDEALLQPPVDSLASDPGEVISHPDPGLFGEARIGLHASADPRISEAEHQVFAETRPGIIKVLSFHSARDIARLAAAHPTASWIVRAFLDFGGRAISPDQFLHDTISDVRRALNELAGKDVIVELHNEPNTVDEGLGTSWRDGAAFNTWWLELLDKYRQALPGIRFMYPGLSPGSMVTGVKLDHVQFVEASRESVEVADGLGVHLYWSRVYPMARSLDVLDDYISRFRFKPIWITEASNNKGGTPAAHKAREYLDFWHALQQRPIVQGVTYFVASASNPDYAEEVWVGRGIGQIIGRR